MITCIYILVFLLLALIYFLIVRTLVIAVTCFTDVPYLPTSEEFLGSILHIMDLNENDNVLDIGSGDGRFILYAAKRYPKVNFTGIERNIILVIWSVLISKILRLKNVSFLHKDALAFKYSRFNKIYMFLTPNFLDKMLNILINQLPNGAEIFCFHFKMGYIFSDSHQISKYPVKYGNKSDSIFKWTKDENSRWKTNCTEDNR